MRRAIIWSAALIMVITSAHTIPLHNFSAAALTATSATTSATQKPRKVTLPAGTRILVRMVDSVDSSKSKTGTRFTATLETHLKADNLIVAPRGATLYGELASAKSAGRYKGSSQLILVLTDIVIGGTPYPLVTSAFEIKGKGEGKKTARKVVGGAGLGAIIGGIAGGGSGALIGTAVGAVGGTAVSASKKGEQVSVPSESLVEFRLEEPASLPVPR